MTFLTRATVAALHDYAIERWGGSYGIRDEGALESAVMQPQASFGGEYLYTFPWGMAVAYAVGLALNHPFVDGNKRTAAIALGTFLEVNAWFLVCSDAELEGAVVGLVTGAFPRADFEAWLPGVCGRRGV